MPPQKKKRIPAYETRAFVGTVVIDQVSGKKKVTIDHPMYYQHEIQGFQVGSQVTVKVTNKKPKRTEAQNRYMHLYFSLIAQSSGHTPREIKNWAKGKVLSKGITEVFGDKVRIVKETSELTVNEMIEFMARIELITGVPLPDPAPFNLPLTHEEFETLRAKQRRIYKLYKAKIK